ncbi:hypothetical protein BJV85_002044 [Clostridium acetobutylicum]|nr:MULTISPECIES: hypothetical protein [Clostridium]ADZ20999.1 Transcriptional regulator, MarR/EmrR family [Clostridium acetobutylicum EA 2018]AEI32084.1 Transcriptional regulator, MarR/EmrR family [Clostridium acetobutylicum DSM 1731]MBC2394365.1 hypothetical protein [Clostridium acetobutylicum]MBC2586495.1 hypothetical protein [Clostridium acetobutylicum]NOV88970.1 hypothetical protein [Clostridium acetobutylicum]
MYEVVLVLPKDTRELEKKYANVLGKIIADKLTKDELECLIKKLEADNQE